MTSVCLTEAAGASGTACNFIFVIKVDKVIYDDEMIPVLIDSQQRKKKRIL